MAPGSVYKIEANDRTAVAYGSGFVVMVTQAYETGDVASRVGWGACVYADKARGGNCGKWLPERSEAAQVAAQHLMRLTKG